MRNDAGRLTRAVAGQLDELRRRAGVSQLELGRRIGRSQSWVGSVLRGGVHFPAKLRSLALLADGLDVELEVVARPRQPFGPAADRRFECFSCPCGFQAFGPAGELGFAEWSPECQRWTVIVPVGPSAYQLQVEQHITGWRERGIPPCPDATARYRVTYC